MTHDNVHIIGQRPSVPSEEGVALTPPDRHTVNLVRRAAASSAEGDWQGTITDLCHAVHVGATKGLQGGSEMELIHELRKVAGFGFPWDDPDRAA